MHAAGHNTPRLSIDLTQVTESTRRALYDAVVRVHFSPTPDEIRKAAEDPDNHFVPDYGPDEAGLSVFWIYGRWIAVWRSLEEPKEAPAEVRWTVLRIGSETRPWRCSKNSRSTTESPWEPTRRTTRGALLKLSESRA